MNRLAVCLMAAGLCGAGAAPRADAMVDGPRFTLVDESLTQVLVSDPSGPTPGPRGELVYSDARGVPRELLASKVLAIAPSWWTDTRAGARGEAVAPVGLGLVVLTDGQRLPGVLSALAPPGESLAWEHPRLGRIVVPLERVSEVELPAPARAGESADPRGDAPDAPPGRDPAPRNANAKPANEPLKPQAPPPTDRSRDTVELANGDRLTGLVERIGDDVVISGSGPGAKATTVAVARVRRMWLANPPASPSGAMVWLADGTVVGTKGFVITPGEPLRLGDWGGAGTPPASEGAVGQGAGEGGAAAYTIEDVAAVAFNPKRLRPLADLVVREQAATGGRKLVRGVRITDDAFRTRALPAPLGARDIELPAPMSADFTLPPGAARVSATIELPESGWTWGDCRVKVEVLGGGGGAVLLDARLNADTPVAKLSGAIPSGASSVRITVEPGERGPVQDRVLVRRGLVVLAP